MKKTLSLIWSVAKTNLGNLCSRDDCSRLIFTVNVYSSMVRLVLNGCMKVQYVGTLQWKCLSVCIVCVGWDINVNIISVWALAEWRRECWWVNWATGRRDRLAACVVPASTQLLILVVEVMVGLHTPPARVFCCVVWPLGRETAWSDRVVPH